MVHRLFQPIYCHKFVWLIWYIVQQNYHFLIFHYYIIVNCYINLNSSIICCHFSGDISFFDISIDFSLVCEKVTELCCGEFLIILFAILSPIKSPVASSAY